MADAVSRRYTERSIQTKKVPVNVKATLRIAHLYAHYLNIYGDRGNILCLQKRCAWRGIDAEVEAVSCRAELNPDHFDLYFIGGGQDKQQQIIAEDLRRLAPALNQSINAGAVILSVCGGYQLLGHYYRPSAGDELRGISLVDAWTVAGSKRMIGNVVVERTSCQSGGATTTLVGFENHSGKTYLGKDTSALGKVRTGSGNNGEDGFEGLCQEVGQGKVYGTYLHGSLLPKNPLLADELIARALRRRHGVIDLSPLADQLENTAHDRALLLRA